MNTFIIIIIIVCRTLAHYVPETDSPHVGTVLFSRKDLNKEHWSTKNVALLKTREHFQNLIPSPQLIRTVNEDYLTNLLTYFENCYLTVKREIKNPSLRNMMDVALSDALGGYLKIWVLPITKYAYYGGTVSLEKSLKIFQAYEDIKSSLKTDGRGWRSPNHNLLNAIAINIASAPWVSSTRSMGNPCKLLAYYENTDTGIKIPLPIINWSITPVTMFLPLRNETIVSLNSPNSSSTLIKFYDIAESCMQSQNIKPDDFNQRFQTWLSIDVAPHLNDDKFYLAFGSILSVMNVTKRFCNKISNTYNHQIQNIKCKAHSFRTPMQITSKKFFLIALILLIEVMWCIPTLYLILSRRRKRKSNNFFNRSHKTESQFSRSDYSRGIIDRIRDAKKAHGVKLFVKPKTRNCVVDVQFPSCNSKHMMSAKTLHQSEPSSENKTLVKEVSLKSSLKKMPSQTSPTPLNEINIISENRNKLKNSIENMEKFDSCQTLTLITNSEKTIKEITYSHEKLPELDKTHMSCKYCVKTEKSCQGCKKAPNCCSCTGCLKGSQTQEKSLMMIKTGNDLKITHVKTKPKEMETKSSGKTVMFSQVGTEKKTRIKKRTIVENNQSNSNKKDTEQPLLRIKIERPQAAIRVGITGYKDRTEATRKPSKIPRLAVKTAKETHTIITKTDKSHPKTNNLKISSVVINKGLVIKGKALDDSVIKHNSIMENKLNVTL